MKEIKSERIRESIHHLAAEFLSAESNRTSLITVTGVSLAPKADRALIKITVLPEDQEKAALEFSKRAAPRLRDFISKKLSLHHVPFITFAIDAGEKNRQKLDELSRATLDGGDTSASG